MFMSCVTILNLLNLNSPITEPSASIDKVLPSCSLRRTSASRASRRSRTAPTAMPAGNVVGRSFSEWTTKSTVPLLSASSKSFVNSDFSPIFGRDMLSIRSPIVIILSEKCT